MDLSWWFAVVGLVLDIGVLIALLCLLPVLWRLYRELGDLDRKDRR